MKLLLGGSPCTFWSIAKNGRETTSSGQGWELFLNYVIAKDKYKPDYFLYENVASMSKAIKQEITRHLGVEPIKINSALVSAQNRERYYWTNIPIPLIWQIKDRGILLKDVLDGGESYTLKDHALAWKKKAGCISAMHHKGGSMNTHSPQSRGRLEVAYKC